MDTNQPTSHMILSEDQLRPLVIARLQEMLLGRPLREIPEIIYEALHGLTAPHVKIRLDQYLDRTIRQYDQRKQDSPQNIIEGFK